MSRPTPKREMGERIRLQCEQCGAPMDTWQECDYCGSRYGDDLARADMSYGMYCDTITAVLHTGPSFPGPREIYDRTLARLAHE